MRGIFSFVKGNVYFSCYTTRKVPKEMCDLAGRSPVRSFKYSVRLPVTTFSPQKSRNHAEEYRELLFMGRDTSIAGLCLFSAAPSGEA